MTTITKKRIQDLLAKATSFKVEEVKPLKEEVWHLIVKHPYPYDLKNIFDSIHAVEQKDGIVVISKYRAIDYSKGTQVEDIEKELIVEIVEPTKGLKRLRRIVKG